METMNHNATNHHSDGDASVRPFRIAVPQSALDDLYERLDRTRWPDELPGANGNYGIALAHVKELAAYWRTT